MTVVEYRRRASLSQPGDVLWRATPERLEQIGADGTLIAATPYRNLRRVRLDFAPGRFQTTRFLMELTGARSQTTVSNIHIASDGSYEDRSASFFPFVRAVVAGVWSANPKAEFLAGEPPALYWSLVALNLVVFSLLAALILALPIAPGNEPLSALIKASLLVFSLGLMLSWAIHARPRRLWARRHLENVLSARSD